MTAPTISAYPKPIEDLLPAALDLADKLGEVPSRNRLMKELKVGSPKATALRDALTAVDFTPTVQSVPDPVDVPPVPAVGPDSLVPPLGITADPTPPVADEVSETFGPVERDGHPGSNITADPVKADTPAPVVGRSVRLSGRGWAYVGVILGGVVSIAANVAHTYLPKPPPGAPTGWVPDPNWSPSPLAVAFSVFWPVALFVAVEILTRVAWGDGFRWFLARVIGVLPVALVAAVVSYRHLAGLLAHFGEDSLTIAIGPLAIDGLMVMASAALLATGHHRHTRTRSE